MNLIRQFFGCCATLAALGMFTSAADAVTTFWNINTNGSFAAVANWNNGVPGAADIAVFDRGSGVTYSVNLNSTFSDRVNDRLVVGSNTVTLNPGTSGTNGYVMDNTTTIEADPIFGFPVRGITIGAEANDTAAVLISHLSLLEAVAATLGHATGSNGTLTLDQNNDLLNITGGSTTNAELIVGRLGTGILNVSAGADVTVNGTAAGFPAGSVSLGRSSSGQGTVNISGAGSTLDVNVLLVVGDAGTGTLNVTAGGLVESLSGILGDLVGSTGTATISGAGSRWNTLFLSVGDAGTGTLNVLDGGVVDILNVGGLVNINGGSTVNLDNGTIDGNVNNSGQINVTGPAAITGSLTIAVNASTLFDPAEPINSVVGLDVGGSITNSGTFTLMLDQSEPVNTAVLKVAGSLSNSGTMNLIIDYAEPVGVVVVDAAGGITNSGTFTMQIDNAEPVGAVTLALGPGQSFTNNATGVVNLNGPEGVPEGETIDAKYVIGGNVVNIGTFNVRTNAQITGSLTTAVDSATVVEPAAPISDMVLEVGGSVTNSGTFTMQVDSAEPCCSVTLELGAGQTFTNNASGVVNLNGPADAGGGETIESKHIIGGNVVNSGQMNVRTNAQVTGSLTTAVDAETVVEPAAPCCGMVLDVAGPVTNSGTFTMRSPVVMDGSGAGDESGSGSSSHQDIVLVAGGGVTNSGTFTMQVDSAEPINSIVQLGAGQTFTNTATGVVNLNGPTDVDEGQSIQSKHIITGSVVNSGELNVRGNTQIEGSLTVAVDAQTIVEPAEPCCNMAFEVAGPVSNSGTFDMMADSIEPCCNLTVAIGAGETFTNNAGGVVRGTGVIDADVLNHGQVQPGHSPGVLTIAGDYTQASDGRLVVDVAGTTAGSGYDQLAIGGETALDGVVEVIFDQDFTPQVGNRFEIITTVEPINDSKFAGASLPGLPEGMDWGIQYAANLVSLAIGVPGDYNANGTVDAADYTVWRDTQGQTGVFLAADGDGDDDVDADDYAFWKGHFGETAGSGSGAGTESLNAAVPEPNTSLLLLFGVVGIWGRITRRETHRGRSLA